MIEDCARLQAEEALPADPREQKIAPSCDPNVESQPVALEAPTVRTAAEEARGLERQSILDRMYDAAQAARHTEVDELTARLRAFDESSPEGRAREEAMRLRKISDALAAGDLVTVHRESAPQNDNAARFKALDLAGPTLDLLERIATGAEVPVHTGLSQLDEQLDGGLWPGLHMIMGGTGGGKTQLCMQAALHAAQSGVPVVYVAFEMSAEVALLRMLGELASVPWGKLMRGRASPEELERVRTAATSLSPHLRIEAARPYGWPSHRVTLLCDELRREHPQGPALVVLDYAQLAGDLSEDTRQRIQGVTYQAQTEANRHRIAMLAVSSTGRPGYGLLADIAKAGGLGNERTQCGGTLRVVCNPHALIGLGKECGELEYGAESVTVLGAGGESKDTGRILLAATVKQRTGRPAWCPLRFAQGRISEARDIQNVEDLPGAAESDGDLDDRVMSTIAGGSYTSVEELRAELGCRKDALNRSITRLREEGKIATKRQRQPFRCIETGEATP